MTRRGGGYTAETGLPFRHLSLLMTDHFADTWMELVKPLAADPPVSVPEPPTSGCSGPMQSWGGYIQSRPPVVDTIDWERPVTFLLWGHAYPCAGGSWTQLTIGLLNHGARPRTPAYLWVIGMAVCGDGGMAALATIWSKNLHVYGLFVSLSFVC